MDPLFPSLPEDLAALSDEELAAMLQEHEVAAELIDRDDPDFTQGLSAEDIIAQYNAGVEQIEAIVAEQKSRVEAQKAYQAEKAALADRRRSAALAEEVPPEGDGDDGDDGDGDDGEEESEAELAHAESELEVEAEVESEVEEAEPVAVVASVEKQAPKRQQALRRPPAPATERQIAMAHGTPLVAVSGLQEVPGGKVMDRIALAKAMKVTATRRGKPTKSVGGVEERILIASAQYPFPAERVLVPGDYEMNAQKIAQMIPQGIPGVLGFVASGGLCAPLEPIYTMPNFASQERPVRAALPSFQADRGGVNVPAATSIGDITTAITTIEEADDALGGTFATKSCQDLSCPAYTEVPVTIISHCREYGNLNAMAWPEKIAHENDLTMAAHARVAEQYLLDRIKALAINVTQAEILGAYADLIHALTKAAAGIRFRLRMSRGSQFRVLLPAWILDLLAADTAMTQFDRYQAQAEMAAHLERYGINVSYYLDDVTGGTSQGFAAEVGASALDDFPDDVQWAIFPEGQFIHVDSGSLELGIVRDSTLNSTNDFQLFGESFENVAMLGPAQGALWVVQGVCPSGEFPALGTALSC